MKALRNNRGIWFAAGGVTAVLAAATLAFGGVATVGGGGHPMFDEDIPHRTAPAIRGEEIAELTAPPMVPGESPGATRRAS